MNILTYKNKAGESVVISHRALNQNEMTSGSRFNKDGRIKGFISSIVIDGKGIAMTLYVSDYTDKGLKHVAANFRKNRIYKLKS